MEHYYKDKQSRVTLVLLHGTGADEHDLVPLAENVYPSANILSLRGQVNENGMLRFFRRYDTHHFDLDSVAKEREVIYHFLTEAKAKYHLEDLVLLGFSNGASMIEALLQKEPERFTGAVLLQPGYLQEGLTFPLKKDLRVFLSVSDVDPYLKINHQKALIKALGDSFDLYVARHDNGHSLSHQTLYDLRNFFKLS